MDKLVFASLFDRNEIIADCLEKGRKATIGEIREWKGQRYQKQGNGQWVPVKGQSSNQPKQEKQDGKIDIKELTNLAKKETESGFDLKEKDGKITITTYPDGEDDETSIDTKGKSKEDIAKEIAKKVENSYANYNYNRGLHILTKGKKNIEEIDKTNTMGNIFTSIHKGLNIDSFNQSKEDFLEKGKRATVGEIRDWKGVKFQKQPNGGWIPVKGQSKRTPKEEITLNDFSVRKLSNGDEVRSIAIKDVNGNVFDVSLKQSYYGTSNRRYDASAFNVKVGGLSFHGTQSDAISWVIDIANKIKNGEDIGLKKEEIPAWMQEMGVKSLEEYREKAESIRKEQQPSRDAELKRLKDDVFTHVGEKDLLYAKDGIEKQIRESTYYKNFYAERATGKYPHDTFDYGSAEADKVVYEEKVKDEEVYLDLLNKELEEVNNALSKISTFEKVQKGDTIQISGTKFEVIGRNADNSIKMKADNGIEISIDKANFEKLGIKSRDEIAKQEYPYITIKDQIEEITSIANIDEDKYIEKLKSIFSGTAPEFEGLDKEQQGKLIQWAEEELGFMEEQRAEEAKQPKIVPGEVVKSPFPDYDPWRD